jgi:adenine phosphoribosyltransferase
VSATGAPVTEIAAAEAGFDLAGFLRARIRDVPDFPQPGIVFKDIAPVLADHVAFAAVVDAIVAFHGRIGIDKVAGIEARGFIFASAVAYHAGAGFVPVRKAGKLPGPTHALEYQLEYGTAALEVPHDAFAPDERVLLVDDVLATGGTAAAARALIESSGARVIGLSVLLELGLLAGRQRLPGLVVHALLLG